MVAAGFTFRKIRTSQTLGEKLRRARKRKGVDFLDAELQTKVRAKYLESLENEDFDLLPNDIYVKGFLAAYCEYLGLDQEKILKLYHQQKIIQKNNIDDSFSLPKVSSEKSITITPKLVIFFSAAIFCISAIVYVTIQVFSFASAPKLLVTDPTHDLVVEEENIKVRGETNPGVALKINKEPIIVSADGKFESEIILQKGINTILITASSKSNKETSRVAVVERKIKTAEK
jgi:cytoskeletal protein RodZ